MTYTWFRKKKKERETFPGTSQVAQCLGFQAFTAVAQVQSLVGELRSYKQCLEAKTKTIKQTKTQILSERHESDSVPN